MIRGIIETLLVGIAFGVTTINVYAFMIYMDEKINENRLYATSPYGIFLNRGPIWNHSAWTECLHISGEAQMGPLWMLALFETRVT